MLSNGDNIMSVMGCTDAPEKQRSCTRVVSLLNLFKRT